MSSSTVLDLTNIQGDILGGLPKRTETCLFFQINNVSQFRRQLREFIPLVKTSAQVVKDRETINDHRRHKRSGLISVAGVNISFSHTGLEKLGIQDTLQDEAFTAGQRKDAEGLGDKGSKANGEFVPEWEPAFLKEIHGVIVVAGDCHDSVERALHRIEHVFGLKTHHHSITEITRVRGDVRPGDQSAHEHFGFLDGVSNPAVDGFDKTTLPGQDSIKPGFILAGREGDTRKDSRPSWAIDGSFLTFRYLFQRVPEFDEFLRQNPINLPGLSREKGSELLGARMVGRWKSGAPIDLTPLEDDPELGRDPQRNNNFRFEGQRDDQTKCPFAAHIRKTYPRADLEDLPPPIGPINVDNRRILRRGIQFGPEVTHTEKHDKKTHHGRGLLFICYSSSIVDGFQFIQQSWANAPNFPFGEQTAATPGFDPIIGQDKNGGIRMMSGADPNDPVTNLTLPNNLFVVPKGGEYFFSPSISALKDTFALNHQHAEHDQQAALST